MRRAALVTGYRLLMSAMSAKPPKGQAYITVGRAYSIDVAVSVNLNNMLTHIQLPSLLS